jgi:putative tricarboxylic transport membrane protein
LVVLGAAGVARGVMVGGWRPPAVMLRPLLCISIAILVFAQTIDRLGIFIACAVTVVVAATAERAARWREVPAIALGLAVFCALLFGYALNLSIPVWPR